MTGIQKSFLMVVLLSPFLVLDIREYFSPPVEINSRTALSLEIPRGATLAQIADSLYGHKLIKNKKLFVIWATSLGYSTKLRAGIFKVPLGLTYAQLVAVLSHAKQHAVLITLIEGWNNQQISRKITTTLKLNKNRFDSLLIDKNLLLRFGIDGKDLTGYLLPDTYAYTYDMKEQEIVEHLLKQTFSIFEEDSVKRALANLKMNRHQILTLASIIEGEAVVDSERALISSVYHNRLRKGMKLQACPTVQYLIPGPSRRLLYKDLEIESPYNTYLHSGLPPGPINNPGRSSILAAVYPQNSNFLFFVAKGDGSHNFSSNAAQHGQAKAAFNQVRRTYRKQSM